MFGSFFVYSDKFAESIIFDQNHSLYRSLFDKCWVDSVTGSIEQYL